MAVGAKGGWLLGGNIVGDFGWWEDFAAIEAAALFGFLQLLLVSDAAIVGLLVDSVFLLLLLLLLFRFLQIPLESSLQIERHMIVRGENMHR